MCGGRGRGVAWRLAAVAKATGGGGSGGGAGQGRAGQVGRGAVVPVAPGVSSLPSPPVPSGAAGSHALGPEGAAAAPRPGLGDGWRRRRAHLEAAV